MRKHPAKHPALVLAALTLLLAATAPALAQADSTSPLREMDLNGDGNIDKAEMEKAADSLFDRADTNHDGMISKAEFKATQAERIAKADSNGDGVINRQDMAGRLQRLRDR